MSTSADWTDEQYAEAYFGWRARANEAFEKGDGAACVGAGARADSVASMFRDTRGLVSRDEAVAKLRRLGASGARRHA